MVKKYGHGDLKQRAQQLEQREVFLNRTNNVIQVYH